MNACTLPATSSNRGELSTSRSVMPCNREATPGIGPEGLIRWVNVARRAKSESNSDRVNSTISAVAASIVVVSRSRATIRGAAGYTDILSTYVRT